MASRHLRSRFSTGRRSLAVLALALVSVGCTAPETQSPDASQPASSTTDHGPSSPSRTAQGTPSPTPGFGIEGSLNVVTVDGLNFRDGPGTDQPVQTVGPGLPTSGEPIRLSAGERVWIIDEQVVDGENWYHVVVEFSFMPGWISGGTPADPWISPFDPATCPPTAAEALAEAALALDREPMRSLICFGDEQVTLDVYWPMPTPNHPCPWDFEPQWLLCYENVNQTGDSAPGLTVYGTTDLPEFTRGSWVTLVGHYNDPRSPGCPEAVGRDPAALGEVAASVLFCRTRFVADTVT